MIVSGDHHHQKPSYPHIGLLFLAFLGTYLLAIYYVQLIQPRNLLHQYLNRSAPRHETFVLFLRLSGLCYSLLPAPSALYPGAPSFPIIPTLGLIEYIDRTTLGAIWSPRYLRHSVISAQWLRFRQFPDEQQSCECRPALRISILVA